MFIQALPFEWISGNRERLLQLPVPTIMQLTLSLCSVHPKQFKGDGEELMIHPLCCLPGFDTEN